MNRRRFLPLIGALALAACGQEPQGGGSDASPVLYEVTGKDGAVEGWLFGTIHSLPGGVQWRTQELDSVVDKADLLVVEIAALDDNAAIGKVFANLAGSPEQPDIGMRVDSEHRPDLFALIERGGYSPGDFAGIETWAVALMLAQVDDDGSSRHGADRALLADFKGREIRELEGAERQLGIFDQLPEQDQSDLLSGVIAETKKRDEDPDRLRRAWLSGDEDALVEASQTGILADRELRQALLVGRNRDWVAQLDAMLKQKPRPLVGVGAAHLVGPDGLAALLEQRGYTVRRLQ